MEEETPQEKILTEVLLEIRFSGATDLSLTVGKLHTELHDDYPIFENLNVPDFPDALPEFNNIVRYRLFSQDKTNLYNLGKGVLSINTLNYQSFEGFFGDVKKVIEKYKQLSPVEHISRIGLRYINKIKVQDRDINDLFNMTINLPRYLASLEKGFRYQQAGKINDDILTTTFGTEQQFSKDIIVLDFDYYKEGQMDFTIEAIEQWSQNAHNVISRAFKESLKRTYYNTLI